MHRRVGVLARMEAVREGEGREEAADRGGRAGLGLAGSTRPSRFLRPKRSMAGVMDSY